jgi:hypothetical protein
MILWFSHTRGWFLWEFFKENLVMILCFFHVMILCFFHTKGWFFCRVFKENLDKLTRVFPQKLLEFFMFYMEKTHLPYCTSVGARHACAQCWGPWVRPVTPPRVSAAAGQDTPGTSATSVLMAGASGTAAADRDLGDLFISFLMQNYLRKKMHTLFSFTFCLCFPRAVLHCKKGYKFSHPPQPGRDFLAGDAIIDNLFLQCTLKNSIHFRTISKLVQAVMVMVMAYRALIL